MAILVSQKLFVGGVVHFLSGGSTTTPPDNGGGGPATPPNADGGYYNNTSTQTYQPGTKLPYPPGTKIVAGEFDPDYAGYEAANYTVTDTSTVADLIAAFQDYYVLSAVDDNGNPVDPATTPFHLKGTSTDGGSYDVVYVDGDGVMRHADSLFDPNATDRASKISFTFLNPPVREVVGHTAVNKTDPATSAFKGSVRYVVINWYASPDNGSAPINQYSYDITAGSISDMIDYFSSQRSELSVALQTTPGTLTSDESENVTGFLHVQSQGGFYSLLLLDSNLNILSQSNLA